MAIGASTLVDVATGVGDQKAAFIINMMSQASPVLEDALWVPANGKLEHRTKMLIGLPTAVWTRLYKGVPPSKGQYAWVSETCGMLESASEIDVREFEAAGSSNEWRLQQSLPHLEAMGQMFESHIFYGSEQTTPESFTGLAPRYGALTGSPISRNIISGGSASTTTNTSIWLVTWGVKSLHCFYPEGFGTAGIQHEPVDNVIVNDASGNRYKVHMDWFRMRPGLALVDWRYNVRIPNIDVSTFGTTSAPDLLDLMNKAIWKLPTTAMRQTNVTQLDDNETREFIGGRPVFYVNRDVAQELERQADNKGNVRITREESASGPYPVMRYKGIEIRVTDSLLSTESLVV